MCRKQTRASEHLRANAYDLLRVLALGLVDWFDLEPRKAIVADDNSPEICHDSTSLEADTTSIDSPHYRATFRAAATCAVRAP